MGFLELGSESVEYLVASSEWCVMLGFCDVVMKL